MTGRFARICFILVLCLTFSLGNKMCNNFGTQITGCNINDNVIKVMTSSVIDCTIACTQDALCQAVSYDKTGKSCKTHKSCPISCTDANIPDPKWTSMCKSRVQCSEIGKRCDDAGFTFVNSLALCYKILDDLLLDRDNATIVCSSHGANLLRIDNEAKELYMEEMLANRPNSAVKYHIDGRKLPGETFKFSNGDTISTFYWSPLLQYQDRDCIAMHASSYGWKDVFCVGIHGYICEIPS